MFKVDQCEGLPERLAAVEYAEPVTEADRIPAAHALMEACGADIRIGGGEAYYSPGGDYVAVPPQLAFYDRINWYRTVLHELAVLEGVGIGYFMESDVSADIEAGLIVALLQEWAPVLAPPPLPLLSQPPQSARRVRAIRRLAR